MQVGMIGLGRMGTNMVRRLPRGGDQRATFRSGVPVLLGAALLLWAPGCAKGGERGRRNDSASAPTRVSASSPAGLITAVQGPSWVKHLGLSIPQTRFGQMGGTEHAPSTGRSEPEPGGENPSSRSLGGAIRRFRSEEHTSE